MNHEMLTRLKTIFAAAILPLALVAAFIGPAAAQSPKLDAPPPMAVGDKWTYKFTNMGDRREPYNFSHQVMRVNASSAWIYGESQEVDARRPKYIWRWDNKRSKVVEGFNLNAKNPGQPGSRYGNWQPEDDFVQFPLEVGRTWKVSFPFTGENAGRTDYTVEVIGYEKIKVAAGEFDAYVIRGRGFWTCESGCSGSGRAEQTIWFAPSVKREVKFAFKDWTTRSSIWNNNERELISWEPAAALPAALAAAATASPNNPQAPSQTTPQTTPTAADAAPAK